jgi:hypothetical protein
MTPIVVITPTGVRELTEKQFADVLVGESVTFARGASLEVVEGDAASVKLDGHVVRFAKHGTYVLAASAALVTGRVRVIVVEDVRDRIHIAEQNLSPGGSADIAKRLVLRSLLLHGGWDGTREGLAGKNLTHFGASAAPYQGVVRF